MERILFLDIETVPLTYRYKDLDAQAQNLWSLKSRWVQEREEKSADEVYERAGIYAEFAKVVCVSLGYFHGHKKDRTFRITSLYGEEESGILMGLSALIKKFFKGRDALLCAHNGKEFDFPFLARRFIINGQTLPEVLDLAGKKPWEVHHLDTMDLWKFGDYKHYTSIDLLSYALSIPSPKNDISGADVARVYYEEKDLERIKTYCEKDVVAVAQVMLKFKGQSLLQDSEIIKI
jgi:predicted PolB exonuclease-like 3'-5' exonuclease